MSGFGDQLKSLRKIKGLTQKEVAEQLGMTQQNYQKWESGKSSPSGETLERLADYFDVSLDFLMGRKNQEIYTEDDLIIVLQDFEKFILPFSLNIVRSSVPKYLNDRKNKRD